ncbi:MAG TPA: hypothetical protein PK529_06855 [Verrucomicrobiales bacterium]|nr:hypothetical protein [Verrucomicrobiales bacterium]
MKKSPTVRPLFSFFLYTADDGYPEKNSAELLSSLITKTFPVILFFNE